MENNNNIECFNSAVEDTTISLNQEVNETEDTKELPKENKFCKYCGKELKEDLKFCSNCGKKCETETVIRYCTGCGEKIENNVKFCPKCGTKVVTPITINLSDADSATGRIIGRISAKKVGIILVALILMVVLVVVGINVIPQIFVSPETLMSEANYQKAYTKAKKDEKNDVLIENLISSICKKAEDNLKDPASFKLRDAWYETTDDKNIVLYISGKNSMGGMTNSYWLYTFDSEDNEYELFTTIHDMEDEEIESYDDREDELEKIINNAARRTIRNIYTDDNKLDEDLIERINGLHSDDLLKDVELLKEVENIYPSDDSDDDV